MADTDIKVKITAKDETKGAVSSVESSFSGMAKKMSVAAVGATAFAFAMNNVKKSLAFADQVDKLNRQYGLSTDFLQRLNAIATASGSSLEGMTMGVKDLTLGLGKLRAGDKELTSIFSKLGISADGRKIEDVFVEIMSKMGDMTDDTERLTVATAIFGRGAREAMATAVQGSDGFKKAYEEASSKVMSLSPAEIKALDDMGDSIGRIAHNAMVAAGKLAAMFVTGTKGYSATEKAIEEIARIEKILARPEVIENKGGFYDVEKLQADLEKYKKVLSDKAKADEEAARKAEETKKQTTFGITLGGPGSEKEAERLTLKGDDGTVGPVNIAAIAEAEGLRQLAESEKTRLNKLVEDEALRQDKLQEVKFATADAWERASQKIRDSDKRTADEGVANAQRASDQEAAIRSSKMSAAMQATDMGINLLGQALNANKRTAEEQKNIAYAMAIANGAASAIKAWDAGMSIPWIGAPAIAAGYLALSLATTGAQIAAISNTSFASGTRNARGGYARVGEYGPEDMYVPPGAAIRNASQTAQTGGGGDAAQNVTINFHTQQNVVETMRLKVRSGEARGFIQDLRGAMK